MIGVQSNAKWFIKLHRRLIKPPYPVRIKCPSCGRELIRVSADTIEIENNHGVQYSELNAKDMWSTLKHTCGAKITFYWKP